jgi:hypothetical protein
MKIVNPKIPLRRVDLDKETGGLPPSLIESIEEEGGLWWASDAYTTSEEVIESTKNVSAVALRLDFRDLSLLKYLPKIRYLHIQSDGALRGEVDPTRFPDLRWLKVSLGGKGGSAMMPGIKHGHPILEWLSVKEVKTRTVAELCINYPNLRVLHIGYADYLRELGNLAEATPNLKKLSLYLTQIPTLKGLTGLHQLETLVLFGGRVQDISPLTRLERLRYVQLELGHFISLEPLRNHKSIRMVSLNRIQESDLSILGSISGLVAVSCTKGFEKPVNWPILNKLPIDDPLRIEWLKSIRE